MLKVSRALALAALLIVLPLLTCCTGMVQDELDATHAKLEKLQKMVAEANNELDALHSMVDLLDDDHTIDPYTLKETEDGYEVSFRDGKTIFIPYGHDGKDGETLIPVGVKSDEDGLYYWTINGEWMLDADGNKIRASATDGVDGIAPQVKVEDGFWWISFDGGKTFEKLASCEEMDGVGVFSGIDLSDPSMVVLKLLDGTVLEFPCLPQYRISFNGPVRDTLLISAGELLPIPYAVLSEGNTDQPITVTSGTDGTYFSEVVPGEEQGQGIVKVQAPAVFSEGYIILNAYCGGTSALKVIYFQERKITPADKAATLRLSSAADSTAVEYKTNFDYTVSLSDTTWLTVVPNPDNGTLTFVPTANEADTVRTCTVTVSPKDNPDFVCTTFEVKQASKGVSYEFESPEGFSLDSSNHYNLILGAPAAGGDAVIWIVTNMAVDKPKQELPEWISISIPDSDEFHKVVVSVQPNDSETTRSERVKLSIGKNVVYLDVNQAAKTGE